MNNMNLARQSYKTVQKDMTSDKSVELRVFMSITAQLRAVDASDKLQFPALSDAIVENLKLWRILFIDLVNPENTLPLDLKTSLIQLAEFTQNHSRRVLLGEATPEVLVDINDSVIAGLRQSMTASLKAGPTPSFEGDKSIIRRCLCQ